MKRGCLYNFVYMVLLVVIFGSSTYFWFTYFVKGRSLPTPNLIGKSVSEARAIAADLGVELEVEEGRRRNSDKVPIGNIVWQNRQPGATSFIKRGSSIGVELSAGPLVLRVPDLAGETAGTGMLRLGQQNLKLGMLSYVGSDAPGILVADPPKDTVVGPQTPISLLVGVPPAPAQYVMPDLIDRPLDRARPALEARGLNIATVKYEAYPGIADGIIIRQYPLRGAPVSTRDPISVVVSRQEELGFAPPPPVVPEPPPAPAAAATGT